MEWTANKTQEDFRVEMRTFQTKLTELKNLADEERNHWKTTPARKSCLGQRIKR